MTHMLWPRAVDRTDVICELHFHPNAMAKPNFEADDAVEFWTSPTVKIGRSPSSRRPESSPAPISPSYSRCESLPHAFDQMVLNREKLDREKQASKKSVR